MIFYSDLQHCYLHKRDQHMKTLPALLVSLAILLSRNHSEGPVLTSGVPTRVKCFVETAAVFDGWSQPI